LQNAVRVVSASSTAANVGSRDDSTHDGAEVTDEDAEQVGPAVSGVVIDSSCFQTPLRLDVVADDGNDGATPDSTGVAQDPDAEAHEDIR
jgi:hypothetical protein